MGNCLIFCAGDFTDLIAPIGKDDYIIAADGGLAHTQPLGITPHCILGDFDSLGYVPEGSAVFPVEKDDTDAMLAVRKGLELGYRQFFLYGSLDGPRLDHTVANFQTLQYLADHGARGYLIGNAYIATLAQEETLRFSADAQGILSVFALRDGMVSLKGLQYSMENGALTTGFPLGVSNHFIGQPATITTEKGSMLLLYDRKNGLPEERLA